MKKITFSKNAAKQIQKLDKAIQKRVKNKLLAYAKGETNALRLKKPLHPFSKLKVGNYRIILDEDSDPIFVIRVEHRSRVYKS